MEQNVGPVLQCDQIPSEEPALLVTGTVAPASLQNLHVLPVHAGVFSGFPPKYLLVR